MNNAVDDFPLAVDEAGVDGVLFGILHFLDDDLFGGLRSDAPERRGVHLGAQTVADFAFGIEFAAFLQGYLQRRIFDRLDDVLELKDFDFAGIVIVLHFNVDFTSELFPCSRFECLFKRTDQNLAINSFVSANLVDDALYIRYKHYFSPL